MIYFLLLGIMLFFFTVYIFEMRKVKFSIRLIFSIALFGAIAYVLNTIKFIRMPQGGSVTLFSMLPVMLISFIHGRGIGITSGILLGLLKMLDGIVFLNPFQFILDYMLANMSLGFASMFGGNSKVRIILGCGLSGFISVFCNILSGVLFFSEFATNGANIWMYSIIYNFSSVGLEVILTTIVMTLLPMERIIRNSNIKNI